MNAVLLLVVSKGCCYYMIEEISRCKIRLTKSNDDDDDEVEYEMMRSYLQYVPAFPSFALPM